MPEGQCRLCSHTLSKTFIDLGKSPLCETFLTSKQLNEEERFYPLLTQVCENCFLVQIAQFVTPQDIYFEYPYFSSFSKSWLEHASSYSKSVKTRFKLNNNSQVVEIASNDGYLLRNFVNANIPCLGIEPAQNVAKSAIENGIPTLIKFFGVNTAQEVVNDFGQADLLVGNNVLAHVPDLIDFIAGMKILLKPYGVITMEFPHLMRLMEDSQFDTIYHEHFSYFSFLTAQRAFAEHGLTIFDVEELHTHGGSLRIFAKHQEYLELAVTPAVNQLLDKEIKFGLNQLKTYLHFEKQSCETKYTLLDFLISAKRAGKIVVGYGAPGKGNTLLNYCGIRKDLLEYTVDLNPLKQGKFTPGTHIPIHAPEHIFATRPDYVLILPWNLAEEISQQMTGIREWGGQFVVPIPAVRIF
ncbi:class I SAM-dependent methyltransferase [Paraglaciecola sp. L3A3]|uniref:class I SAM-dependent methyltransferase n=1 Tax=Paraglaciecola sp. L3A3 TaxID=2686358 RepID=UPI00131DC351|nr:class I SAM-dependent methyltransferase [Paraglaciecola sp. L3A3]